jgi:NADPH-dependent curcumin reductase CurA
VSDHGDMRDQFLSEMIPWIVDGKVKSQETVFEGIDNALDAFLGLFSGENFGKMVVKL